MASSIKQTLDAYVEKYLRPEFIEADPIGIVHRFSRKEDIEIAGFLVATISWGNRKAIVAKAGQMMDCLDNAPYDFVANASPSEIQSLSSYVYRTFQQDDFPSMIRSLREIYANGGLEPIFTNDIASSIIRLRTLMLPNLAERTQKHIANVANGSAAKRINMFLRWMVRPPEGGVDFGIWKNIDPASLMLPLDVHTARTSRKLGLLQRKQNDWLAVEEITARLSEFCPTDPVRYDFALFGMGINSNDYV